MVSAVDTHTHTEFEDKRILNKPSVHQLPDFKVVSKSLKSRQQLVMYICRRLQALVSFKPVS